MKRRKLRSGSLKKSEDLLFTKEESPVFFRKDWRFFIFKILPIELGSRRRCAGLTILWNCRIVSL